MDEVQPDSRETCDLLQKAGAGDRKAVDRLLARHRPDLRRFIELRLDAAIRARVDPSDVVQETQLEAFRRLPDFLERRPMPFRLWLRKTAYERLLKVQRHHRQAAQRSVEREVAWPEHSSVLLAQRLLGSGPSPSQRLAQREIVRRVRQALAKLSQVDREILLMRQVEELSYQEVAWLLEIEPAAARQRYGRALLRLRKVLFEGGPAEAQP
jgi:RNA polymerase sigma-70 factor (ECF subfamily)